MNWTHHSATINGNYWELRSVWHVSAFSMMNTYIKILLINCCIGLIVTAQPAITVYNENFAVVRDTVPLDLDSGANDVSYSGVTAQLEPVTLRDDEPRRLKRLKNGLQSFLGQEVRNQKDLYGIGAFAVAPHNRAV